MPFYGSNLGSPGPGPSWNPGPSFGQRLLGKRLLGNATSILPGVGQFWILGPLIEPL